MSTTAGPVLVNGFASSSPREINETQEYEKILKLRDEIFAGSHPRLTVPAHAIRKVSSSLPLPYQSHFAVPPSSAAQLPQSNLPGLSVTSGEDGRQNSQLDGAVGPRVTASGIDPVLLTKSDGLIKAETSLARQRLEKQLKDQFEQKRLDARKRPAPAEAKPDFDINAVFAKALEIAKPETLVKTADAKGDESDSVDEDSYYSSKAPDSPPEAGEHTPSSQEQILQESFGANGPAEAEPTLIQITEHKQPMNGATAANGFHSANTFQQVQPNISVRKTHGTVDLTTTDLDDEDEEGEYSPPEATEQFVASNDPASHTVPDPRNRPLRRYSEADENGKRRGSPSEAHLRIVRNQIKYPIAPQPLRVSPLAFTKGPPILQDRRSRNGRQRHRAGSQSESPEPAGHTRKKRKLDRKAEKKNRKSIKQEPVSPPPFHEVQPLGSGKVQSVIDDRPITIEDQSPQQVIRYDRAPDRYVDSPSRVYSPHVEPVMPLSEPRVSSRALMRPVRDDQDLRRVASMHNLRTEQPREYVEYATPTRARTPSYVSLDSPMRMETPRAYVPEFERQPQEIRVMRTPAPEYQQIRDAEQEVRYIPEPMPPPIRERIVIDQYGNRFREVVQERASLAPRTVSASYAEPEYYNGYERSRAQSVMRQEPPDTRYVQQMPPPKLVRQPEQNLRTSIMPTPVSRDAYDMSARLRSGSVQPMDRPVRQPTYVEDTSEYRQPVRMASVRPPATQYEERTAIQMVPRGQSIRPTREGSVFAEDRGQVRREYIPAEPPRYRVMEPEMRYVDAQGREIIQIDGTQDGGPRYVSRY